MKKFIIFIVLVLTSAGAIALTEQERILKETILYEAGGSYLQNSLYKGRYILRWNKAYFPIKVYVESSTDVPNYYSYEIIRAVKLWQKELEGVAAFKFITNENAADIAFVLTERSAKQQEGILDEITDLAYTQPVIKNNKLKKMYIKIYKKDDRDRYYKPQLVLNIAVHEFAHALGVMGHSDNPKSTMHTLLSSETERTQININSEDKSTVKLLYMTEADITNGDKNRDKGGINAEIMLGTLDERLNFSIKNAANNAFWLRQDSSSWLDLAYLHEQKHDFVSMFEYLEQAKKYAKTPDEIFNVYIGYSAYCTDKNNPLGAIWYIIKACLLKKSSGLFFMI